MTDNWRIVQDHNEDWWVEDGHGYTQSGSFANQIIANEWLAEFRQLREHRRATVEQETAERMRRPIDPVDLYGARNHGEG